MNLAQCRGTATVLKETFHDYDRLECLLFHWAAWMRTGFYAKLRTPGRSACIGISHSADFDQLADAADRSIARAVDAAIQDLKPLEQKALRCAYLGEQWASPLSEAAVLVVAREHLSIVANRRGLM